MKVRHFSFLLVLIFAAASLASCGGGGGAPGSDDTNKTEVLIQSVLISAESDDIDVVSLPLLCDGEDEEPLTDANATMEISATTINQNPAFLSPFPANIEQCFISYTSAVIGAPIIESKTVYPNCSFIDGTTSCTVELLNIARKDQWWDDVTSGKFTPENGPTTYTVSYSCTYQNSFGKTGQLGGRMDIDLSNWLSCGG
ncbi:MAG: hypothetical protein H6Q92_315 [Nitrospirae bacterium]|nr:hypothetical protein [Nitrospirota bacterium]